MGDEVGGGGSLGGVGLEALEDEGLGLLGQVLGDGRVYFEHADLEHGGLWGGEFHEGRIARGHLDDGAAVGPDVGGGAVAAESLVDDLGGHVLERAREGVRAGVEAGEALAGAEVGYLADAGVGVDEDVVALDVPVDDELAVEVAESVDDLAGVVGHGGLVVHQGAPLGAQEGGEAAARDLLHEDAEDLLVLAHLAPQVLHDVTVLTATRSHLIPAAAVIGWAYREEWSWISSMSGWISSGLATLTSLTAIVRWVLRSRAAYTVPYVPRPSITRSPLFVYYTTAPSASVP